jgi:hypothetical protein
LGYDDFILVLDHSMSVLLSGIEFKLFLKDEAVWGPGKGDYYYDDSHILINGRDDEQVLDELLDNGCAKLPDVAMVEIRSGYVLSKGEHNGQSMRQLDEVAAQWLSSRDTRLVSIRVPNAVSLGDLDAALGPLGIAVPRVLARTLKP